MSITGPILRRYVIGISTMALLFLELWRPSQPVFAAQTIIDSESPSLLYSPSNAWFTYYSDTAYGGSVRYTTTAGATVSYSFTGTSITFLYSMAFNRGAIEVDIDEVIVDRLNGHIEDWSHNPYARVHRRQTAKTYSGLSYGQHIITIRAIPGDDNSRIFTDVDAFIINPDKAGSGTYDDTHSYVTVFSGANWHTWYCSDCYNGSQKYTSDAGAGVRFTFEGDTITWYYTKANNRGLAGVTIDGENKNWNYGYFDLYSPTTLRNQFRTFTGLGGGTHTIAIYNVHQKNPSSSDYYIDVDRFVVGSTKSYQRTTAANYADARTHIYNCNYYFVSYSCYIQENDCMNFSSQVMHTGGLPYVPLNPPWHDWATEWYYDNTALTSSLTWRHVPTFMGYLSGRTTEFNRTTSLSELRRGDLIPLDLMNQYGQAGHDGIADHMRIVIGAGLSSPLNEDYSDGPNLVFNPEFDLLIDQHSIDRWQVPWDYNISDPLSILDFIRIIKN